MRDLKFVFATIFIALLVIVVSTFYKVKKQHEDRVVAVTEKRITEAAMKCNWDGICTEDLVTLGELIHLGYAKEEVNPITKMYYSHSSYIEIEGNTYIFHEV